MGTNGRGRVQLDWWKEGLRLNLHIRPAGLALAVLYAFACWAARQLSLDQFYLPAGVRVAAVLLCPPRLWPYLLLGEYAYFAQMRYPMIDKYGLTWVIVGSACLMPAVMLVVRLHHRMMAATKTMWLISVAAASAVVVTALNIILSELLWPTPPDMQPFTGIARYVVGDFIGILTIAPLALLWARRQAEPEWTTAFRRQTLAALSLMLLLGISALWLPSDSPTAKTSVQLLMAVPAIALTCLHGWRGAAIGVPALNLIIGLTTPGPYPSSFDPATFTTQQIMAIAGAALFVLGARITQYYHRYRLRDVDEKNAIKLARSSHMASEMDLRERAMHLRKIGDGMDMSLNEVVDWLKLQGHHAIATSLLHTSSVHSRQFREQASMVYPTALEQVGLYVALQAGGVREAWELTHRVARPQLGGDPCQLSIGLQLATYRTLTDAVSLLLKQESGQIRVRARCGRFGQNRGILVSVGLLDSRRPLSPATTALAVERLAGRTIAYGGAVQCHRNRVRMVLMETAINAGNAPAPFGMADRLGVPGRDSQQALT
jgi:hypothetical protein